jgi:hypothetical protein
MKYFTPERYIAYQDCSSDAAMNAADADWEAAGERYLEYYQSVEPRLPPGIRKMQESYYLHDAVVFTLGREGNRFVIVLQLDVPPGDVLTFTYELDGEPRINRAVLPAGQRSEGRTEWMYDEVELISDMPPIAEHSILLSNGWEVGIPFRDVQAQEAQALLPVPRHAKAAAARAAAQPSG